MINLEAIVEQIERKVKRVVGELDEVRTQNTALKKERDQLLEELKKYKAGVLPEEKVNEVVQGASEEEVDREHVRAEIDRYIKDIDHCLELIKQL